MEHHPCAGGDDQPVSTRPEAAARHEVAGHIDALYEISIGVDVEDAPPHAPRQPDVPVVVDGEAVGVAGRRHEPRLQLEVGDRTGPRSCVDDARLEVRQVEGVATW